ncbi:MAG TPA: hypothetical protein VGR28_05355 [Candidatus Thermoplasmatota archaeon]|jgi:hypothetical protein|nr:hypothetical protein [Candidatus Thermoplasmatota archaeon]
MRILGVFAGLLVALPAAGAPGPAAPEGQFACFGLAPLQTSCVLPNYNAGSLYVRGPCPVNQGFVNCFFGTIRGAIVSQETGASFSITCDMLPGPIDAAGFVACTQEGSAGDVAPPFDIVCDAFFYDMDTPGGVGVFECGVVL